MKPGELTSASRGSRFDRLRKLVHDSRALADLAGLAGVCCYCGQPLNTVHRPSIAKVDGRFIRIAYPICWDCWLSYDQPIGVFTECTPPSDWRNERRRIGERQNPVLA
jgi:hypothetical protein